MSDRSEIEEYDFNGSDVRVTTVEGEPWFVARDVGEALDIQASAVSKIVKGLPDHFVRMISIHTNGGPRNYLIVSYEGVVKMLIRSRKPKAEEFQDWIAFEVVPSIKEKGYYFAQPMNEMERIVQIMDAMSATCRKMIAQEKQLSAHGEKIDDHENRIYRMETKAEQQERLLKQVERAKEKPNDKTTRAKIVELVRAYCLATGVDYPAVWNKAYNELKYRYGIDLRARARNQGKKPLDIAEEIGAIHELFIVASFLCQLEE